MGVEIPGGWVKGGLRSRIENCGVDWNRTLVARRRKCSRSPNLQMGESCLLREGPLILFYSFFVLFYFFYPAPLSGSPPIQLPSPVDPPTLALLSRVTPCKNR